MTSAHEAFFTDANKKEWKTVTSPSGRYRLVLSSYKTKDGCWHYTRGEVYAGKKLIADVKRNYSAFPHSWIEGHKNGHDYLICGEDYQGQTVIELDTGKRVDHMSKGHEKGHGFCWAAHMPSPDGTRLLVSGCYWACPYEFVIFDFSEPMKPPWEILFRCDDSGADDEDSINAWVDNDTCRLGMSYRRLKEDGRADYLMTLEELKAANTSCDAWENVDEFIVWKHGEGIVGDKNVRPRPLEPGEKLWWQEDLDDET